MPDEGSILRQVATLRGEMDRLRLTQSDLSRLSGVSRQTINYILGGRVRRIKPETLRSLRRALRRRAPPSARAG